MHGKRPFRLPHTASVAVVAVVWGALALGGAGCRPKLPPATPTPLPAADGKPALLAGAPAPLSPRVASYALKAKLDTSAHKLSGQETLHWKNNGQAPVDSVPLHLYMNAFKNETSVFMRESHGQHRSVRKEKNSWGWIDVSSIVVAGGAEVRPGAKFGEDETTLEVPLGRSVAPGEELVLDIRFEIQLPEVFARTGYKDAFHMIGQWFPKIGVLTIDDGAQRWHCDTFHLNSEFFADFGNYEVELDVPDDVVVAATGVLTAARDLGGGRRLLTYHAEDVHDFAWMADPYMKVLSGHAKSSYGDVEVRIYYRPSQEDYASRHLEAAVRTIETFGRLFVPYPWAIMSVIDPPMNAAGSAGGMEYPTLVTTAADIDSRRLFLAEEVTVHEVGHNWFQGMLASNEVDEAFLDEGLNEYSDGLVLDPWLGAHTSAVDTGYLRMGYYEAERVRTDPDTMVSPIATPSYRFAPGEYSEATYSKTLMVMKALEAIAGHDQVLSAMGAYAKANAFRHPTRADFFAALKTGLGGDYAWFYEPAFLAAGGVDFRVEQILNHPRHPPAGVFGEGDARKTVKLDEDKKTDAWSSEVTVVNVGKLIAPADVLVTFDDGETVTEHWDGKGGFHTYVFERASEVVGAEIDPEGKITVEHERLKNGEGPKRFGPSLRAAARTGFWEQTLEQVVGL